VDALVTTDRSNDAKIAGTALEVKQKAGRVKPSVTRWGGNLAATLAAS
jgi:hypothetical protein